MIPEDFSDYDYEGLEDLHAKLSMRLENLWDSDAYGELEEKIWEIESEMRYREERDQYESSEECKKEEELECGFDNTTKLRSDESIKNDIAEYEKILWEENEKEIALMALLEQKKWEEEQKEKAREEFGEKWKEAIGVISVSRDTIGSDYSLVKDRDLDELIKAFGGVCEFLRWTIKKAGVANFDGENIGNVRIVGQVAVRGVYNDMLGELRRMRVEKSRRLNKGW